MRYMPHLDSLMSLSSYDLKKSLETKERVVNEGQHDLGFDIKEGDSYSDDFISFAASQDANNIGEILSAFRNGRFYGENVKIKELMTTHDFPKLFYAATEIVMKSRIIPQRVISENLFRTIPYAGTSSQVTIRTLGGVKVEEVPEGGPYPETGSAVNDQAYRINLEIKKYGAKIAGTRDLIESDNWGIFAYTLEQLAVELANKKEKLCVGILNEMCGHVLKDNAAAATTPLGSCTGRGIDGAQNGALGIDDIMDMLAYMQMRGYTMDTVILHPFAWSLWVRDPEIREVMLDSNVIYTPGGAPAPGWGDPTGFGGLGVPFDRFGSGIGQVTPAQAQAGNYNTLDPLFGKLGIAPYAWPNLTPFGATFHVQPKFIDKPLKVIISPLVPYYKISGGARDGKYATNIIFADSQNTGLILQKESPAMEEWSDIEREINYIKIRERYGLALLEQGRSVCMAKNVVIDRTYTFDNVNSRQLSPLTTGTNLV